MIYNKKTSYSIRKHGYYGNLKKLITIMARTNIRVEGQDASDGSQGSKNRSTSCEVICEK
jgi:hypothetical protein